MAGGITVAMSGDTLVAALGQAARASSSVLMVDGAIGIGDSATRNVVVPGGLRLAFTQGGRINLGASSLHVESAIEAGDWPVFTGGTTAGSSVTVKSGAVRAAWWGLASAPVSASAQDRLRIAPANVFALRSACASVAGNPTGRTVILPAGDFPLDVSIELPPGLLFRGAGSRATRLRFVGTAMPEPTVGEYGQVRCAGDVHLTGFGIVNSENRESCGLLVPGASRLDDVVIEGFHLGVRAPGQARLEMARSGLVGNRYGLLVERSVETRLHDVEVVGLVSSTGTSWGAMFGGTGGSCGHINLRASRFVDGGTGLWIAKAKAVAVTDCRFTGLEHAVRIDSDALVGPYVRVGMSRFENCDHEVTMPANAHLVRVDRAGGRTTRVTMKGDPPTGPQWRSGDILYNDAVVPGEPSGWICLAQGGGGQNWRGFAPFAGWTPREE